MAATAAAGTRLVLVIIIRRTGTRYCVRSALAYTLGLRWRYRVVLLFVKFNNNNNN